jgi:hypothetical protein
MAGFCTHSPSVRPHGAVLNYEYVSPGTNLPYNYLMSHVHLVWYMLINLLWDIFTLIFILKQIGDSVSSTRMESFVSYTQPIKSDTSDIKKPTRET